MLRAVRSRKGRAFLINRNYEMKINTFLKNNNFFKRPPVLWIREPPLRPLLTLTTSRKKALSPNTLGVRTSAYELGEGNTIQSIAEISVAFLIPVFQIRQHPEWLTDSQNIGQQEGGKAGSGSQDPQLQPSSAHGTSVLCSDSTLTLF